MTDSLIPTIDALYNPTEYFDEVKKVVLSQEFFPIFISGLSGTGKTILVKQVCSTLNRELYRVNITVETDEDQLIGGFRLVDGNTEYFKGPVIQAMEAGAVLLLDEIDLASPQKIMCLQSILEGDGYYIKRIAEYIEPKKGFTIIATANTKGKGDDEGLYIGTAILNEAFLERFPITFEKEFPSFDEELKILTSIAEHYKINDDDYILSLVKWAHTIRESYKKGVSFDHVISTRRLVQILKSYSIFRNKRKSVLYCINRFDETHKTSFITAYDVHVKDIKTVKTSKKVSNNSVNSASSVTLEDLEEI